MATLIVCGGCAAFCVLALLYVWLKFWYCPPAMITQDSDLPPTPQSPYSPTLDPYPASLRIDRVLNSLYD